MAEVVTDKLAELSVGGPAASEPVADARDDAYSAAAPGGDVGGAAGGGDGAKSAAAPSAVDAAARAASDSRKLFVGGLPQGSTEEAITDVFAPFGVVEEVRARLSSPADVARRARPRAHLGGGLCTARRGTLRALALQVHLIKPNPSSESKRGCCFVTYETAAEAEAAMKALNGHVCDALGGTMPLLVRIADPPRSREEQRSRAAQQQAAHRVPAQVGVLSGWPGALGYGWPPQQAGAFAGGGSAQPFFLQPGAAPSSPTSGTQFMGVFSGGYGFGMLPPPQYAQTQHGGDWSEHADAEGNKYYYNSQTGISQWEPPPHWAAQQAQQLPMMYPYAQALPAGCAPRAVRAAPPPGCRRAELRSSTRRAARRARYFSPAPSNGAASALALSPIVAAGAPLLTASGKRGPKGANLAIFCIPNSYTDLELHVRGRAHSATRTRRSRRPRAALPWMSSGRASHAPSGLAPHGAAAPASPPLRRAQDIARPYGSVIYAQVSRHRDTGLSRGYGFVSYESVADAEKAIEGIHGMVVQGRSLRVEKVKADEDQQRTRCARPQNGGRLFCVAAGRRAAERARPCCPRARCARRARR